MLIKFLEKENFGKSAALAIHQIQQKCYRVATYRHIVITLIIIANKMTSMHEADEADEALVSLYKINMQLFE